MIKPNKKHFLTGENKAIVKSHSIIDFRMAVDLLKIEKHGRIQMNSCGLTGRKSVSHIPNIDSVSAQTGIPKQRIKQLIKMGLVEESAGVLTTFKGFVHFWYFVGANPWHGVGDKK